MIESRITKDKIIADGPTLQIPRDVIEPIIQAQITASIATALGSKQILVHAVETILQTKVDCDGKADRYSDSRGRPWVEWAVADALKKAVRAAIVEAVAKEEVAIRNEIAAQLSQKKSPLVKQLIEALVTGVFKADNLKYRLTVSAD